MSYKIAYETALAADEAWQAELKRLFGKQAGDIRYTDRGKGKPGSKLRRLHDNFMISTQLWMSEMAKQRAPSREIL